MNLSTAALLLIAWLAFGNNGNNGNGNNSAKQQNTPKVSPLDTLTGLLNDDTKNIINCFNTLRDNKCSQQDKTGAIFQMMSNPAVMNIASSFFGGNGAGEAQQQKSEQPKPQCDTEMKNNEGYAFEQPSQPAQEFFRPIDNIADAEVKHKLYWFYDNWYIK